MRTLEPIGKRIARLRQQNGWTQQALAARLAISRVAVSHLEMNLTIPGERTITLLAGLFKITPHALVAGTTYPHAKSERLPQVACCYTALELDLALMHNDLAWLERLNGTERERVAAETRAKWAKRLAEWIERVTDDSEKELLEIARKTLSG
jgi:transcriptional regulator with XRE-family HTH domain